MIKVRTKTWIMFGTIDCITRNNQHIDTIITLQKICKWHGHGIVHIIKKMLKGNPVTLGLSRTYNQNNLTRLMIYLTIAKVCCPICLVRNDYIKKWEIICVGFVTYEILYETHTK